MGSTSNSLSRINVHHAIELTYLTTTFRFTTTYQNPLQVLNVAHSDIVLLNVKLKQVIDSIILNV